MLPPHSSCLASGAWDLLMQAEFGELDFMPAGKPGEI